MEDLEILITTLISNCRSQEELEAFKNYLQSNIEKQFDIRQNELVRSE